MTRLQRRPVVLIIRDGWGTNPDPQWNHANAVHLASTPVDDYLMQTYPHVLIHTSGEHVGLADGITGNSEVGHQNLGAGRIVDQELMRITRAIRDGSFYDNAMLRAAFARAAHSGGKVHLLGLCSSAGVHSTLEHCYALLELARRMEFPGERVYLHCITDGRDSPPSAGAGYVREIEARMKDIGVGRIASVIGRFYAMDRDYRWDRVQQAYALLVDGTGHPAASAEAACRRYYDQPSDPLLRGDEFIEPSPIVAAAGQPLATVADGDSIIFFNFRGDRPRELTRAFVCDPFPYRGADKTGTTRELGFTRGRAPRVTYCTMTEYEAGLPVTVAFPKPPKMRGMLGEVLSDLGLTQFRTAETEKFPHVTFFFNDYREQPFAGEERYLVQSPREVSTYDQAPAMSAHPVTAELVNRIEADRYDFVVVNYANPDMVGHTGVLDAAIQAVETVDQCVGQVIDAVLARGGAAVVTADHGNCEQMIDPATGGPHTSHTVFDVALIVVDARCQGRTLRSGGRLADVAPTLLQMMDLQPPPEMTGRSLLQP